MHFNVPFNASNYLCEIVLSAVYAIKISIENGCNLNVSYA